MADGAMVSHPRGSSVAMLSSPSQGRLALAFRPACADWIRGTAPAALMPAAISASAALWASFHSPESPGVIRPSGDTAVASTTTSPAPPRASDAWCTRCQSLRTPSTATSRRSRRSGGVGSFTAEQASSIYFPGKFIE
jgi:hypothetical protein